MNPMSHMNPLMGAMGMGPMGAMNPLMAATQAPAEQTTDNQWPYERLSWTLTLMDDSDDFFPRKAFG